MNRVGSVTLTSCMRKLKLRKGRQITQGSAACHGRSCWVWDRRKAGRVMKGRVFLLRKRFSSSGKTCGVWDWFLLEVAKIASSRLLLLGNPTDESGSVLSPSVSPT